MMGKLTKKSSLIYTVDVKVHNVHVHVHCFVKVHQIRISMHSNHFHRLFCALDALYTYMYAF